MEETRPCKRSKTSTPPGEKDKDNENNSKQPLLVFAHGAGAPSTSQWMIRWKKMLASATGAVEVITFDYPYFSGGKHRAPPKAEKLVDPHVEEVKKAVSKHPGNPLVLVGKSMGSRVSCMVREKEDIDVSAVVCLGYPLKGSKDALCPVQKLEAVRQKMTAMNELYVIDGGNHSLEIGKKLLKEKGINQVEAEMQALMSIQSFVSRVLMPA